ASVLRVRVSFLVVQMQISGREWMSTRQLDGFLAPSARYKISPARERWARMLAFSEHRRCDTNAVSDPSHKPWAVNLRLAHAPQKRHTPRRSTMKPVLLSVAFLCTCAMTPLRAQTPQSPQSASLTTTQSSPLAAPTTPRHITSYTLPPDLYHK